MWPPLILFAIFVLLLFYIGTRKPKGYPPGPKWLPILGSALEVAGLQKKIGYLYETCTYLSEKYGSVVGLKVGRDRIVVLNSYDSMKSMMMNEDCDGRPIGPVYEVRTWGKRRGVLLTDGPLWVEQRRFIIRHLRDFGFGKNNMATMIEEEAKYLVDNLMKELNSSSTIKKKSNGINNNDIKKKSFESDVFLQETQDFNETRRISQTKEMVVQMDEVFGVPILNTLWTMMAGKRYNYDDEQLNHLQRILTTLLNELEPTGCLFGHFPILRYIAPVASGYTKFVETHQQLLDFLNFELMDHKEKFDPDVPKDLMDAYLKTLQSESSNDTFSEIQLLAICADLFMTGSETTTKALNFCFLYLVLYPEVQRKAQEEIDRVIGRDRLPCLSDRPRMTYVNAVSLECVRMFAGRAVTLPHRALKDTWIMGHRIPKDTMIVANFNRILMNDSWGDPQVFRPERFIDAQGNISIPEQYMPFSMGKRHCMGEVLAKSNIFLFTAALLQAFTFSPVPGEDKPTMALNDGFTPSPVPFRVLISKRS